MSDQVQKDETERQEKTATIYKGDTFVANFWFDNPVPSGTVTVDYDDEGEEETFTFSGRVFLLHHVYTTLGSYEVKFRVIVDQEAIVKDTHKVTVLAPTPESIRNKIIQMLHAGAITKLGNSVYDKLVLTQSHIDDENYAQAKSILQALINQIKGQIDIHFDPGAVVIAQIQYLLDSFPKSLGKADSYKDKFERLLEIKDQNNNQNQNQDDDQNALKLGLEDLKIRIAVALGVEESTEEKHLELIDRASDVILKKIFLDTLDKLSDQDAEEYAKLIEVEASPEYVNRFLNKRIPGYGGFIKKIVDDFLNDLKEAGNSTAPTS